VLIGLLPYIAGSLYRILTVPFWGFDWKIGSMHLLAGVGTVYVNLYFSMRNGARRLERRAMRRELAVLRRKAG